MQSSETHLNVEAPTNETGLEPDDQLETPLDVEDSASQSGQPEIRLNVEASTSLIEPDGKKKVTIIEIKERSSQIHKLTTFKDLGVGTNERFFGQLKSKKGERELKGAMIHRVAEVLQRNGDFKEYYRPTEMSFGPLHAADPNLFKAQLKVDLAAWFIKESGHTAFDLFKDISNNLEKLKKSFDEEEVKSYEDDMLARLFFLDGCAILQFIDSYVHQTLHIFGINNGQAELIRQDLFVLENQIPFQILQWLMSKKCNGISKILVEFTVDNNLMELVGPMYSHSCKYLLELVNSRSGVDHLLHLLRSVLLIDSPRTTSRSRRVPAFIRPIPLFSAMGNLTSNILFDENWYLHQSFRNVRELKAAGITLKTSDSCSLNYISFRALWFLRGRVELPPLLVDGSTARKMLNMVAYEMFMPDYSRYVTSYINLLDLLIDGEEDVKLLRSADILRNRLSSDVEVAALFNKIGSTCLAPAIDTYVDVKSSIENHCKRKLAVWRAQVYHSHFSNPWTILALLATITILLLTAIQTWFAVHPRK